MLVAGVLAAGAFFTESGSSAATHRSLKPASVNNIVLGPWRLVSRRIGLGKLLYKILKAKRVSHITVVSNLEHQPGG